MLNLKKKHGYLHLCTFHFLGCDKIKQVPKLVIKLSSHCTGCLCILPASEWMLQLSAPAFQRILFQCLFLSVVVCHPENSSSSYSPPQTWTTFCILKTPSPALRLASFLSLTHTRTQAQMSNLILVMPAVCHIVRRLK